LLRKYENSRRSGTQITLRNAKKAKKWKAIAFHFFAFFALYRAHWVPERRILNSAKRKFKIRSEGPIRGPTFIESKIENQASNTTKKVFYSSNWGIPFLW
jgi:hypothetical protein